MAQTGYTPILIYSSSTAAAAPTVGNLTNSTLGSELAINITDGKLFYKDNANAIQVIGWKTVPTSAGGTGLTSYTAGDLLYYATGTTLTKLAIGTNTTVLTSSGTAPQWTAQSSLSVGTASNLKSNATTGVMQIVGPAAASTRVMTIPDANFTVARLDGAQTFTAAQTIETTGDVFVVGSSAKKLFFRPDSSGEAITTQTPQAGAGIYFNDTGDAVWLLTGGTARLTANTAGNVTVDTGNLVIGTAGKGIDFSANTHAAGMTTELLSWYEEGNWTPTDNSGAGLTITVTSAKYVRIGRTVFVQAYIIYPATASGANAGLAGLPFTVATNIYAPLTTTSGSGTAISIQANSATTTMTIVSPANYNTAITNATLSGSGIIFSGHYTV